MEQFTTEVRLGDVIDDFCIKCRRLTNHSIVSILDGKAAKVRCRTCYNDHDYRFEQAPPSKKDLKKAELFKEVLAAGGPAVDLDLADLPEMADLGDLPEVADLDDPLADADLMESEADLGQPEAEEPVKVEEPPPPPAAKKGRGRTKKA